MGQDLGDLIQDVVDNAMKSMNFEQLNRNISRTVSSALDEASKSIRQSQADAQQKAQEQQKKTAEQAQRVRQQAAQMQQQTYVRSQNMTWQVPQTGKRQEPSVAMSSNGLNKSLAKGNVSGMLLIVFGWIGIVSFGIMSIIFGSIGLISGFAGINMTAVRMIVFLLLSIIATVCGSKLHKRGQRYLTYIALINGREFVTVDELAKRTGQTQKYTARDLEKMIRLGMFPAGHLDDNKTTLMITPGSYQSYLQAKESMRQRELAVERQRKLSDEEQLRRAAETPQQRELRETFEKGEAYLKKIDEANAAIPGEQITAQINRLAAIVRRIFTQVQKHPEQLPELRRFMDYYLPTTEKLVQTYRELDEQPVQGDTITKSKTEIEKTLDTIEKAFEKLFDSLFENTAMDVSADITVLNTILAQEGLAEQEMKLEKNRMEDNHE